MATLARTTETIGDRLLEAAERLESASLDQCRVLQLRPQQVPPVRVFADWIQELATAPRHARAHPWCRLVMPPRTGKTVIAGRLIEASGLTTTYVVPTKALVRQTVRALTRQLPGTPVGSYYSDDKSVVERGVNVITYASLASAHERGALPRHIRGAELVIADEAHRSMTKRRQRALAQAFASRTPRVALTATPDYDSRRRLERYFPERLAELRLADALAAGLLSEVRVWIAEVDAAGTEVKWAAGDYESGALGRALGAIPGFEVARRFREQHVDKAALFACATRQQAHDLASYLNQRRPAGTSPVEVILGETPRRERERILDAFAQGEVDSLVQVGVLLEGWDSPRCKVLIDLAPTTSRVRATQKYFRVMTPYEEQEAAILVLLPERLSRPPLTPLDLLLPPGEDYFCGAPVRSGGGRRALDRRPLPTVATVRARERLLVNARLGAPTLDIASPDAVREVLERHVDFVPTMGRKAFDKLWFSHRTFSGSGPGLLRYLRVARHVGAYDAWLAELYPGRLAVGDPGLGRGALEAHAWVLPLDDEVLLPLGVHAPSNPEEALMRGELARVIEKQLELLRPRERLSIELVFGLGGHEPHTYVGVGHHLGVSGNRVRQIVAKALRLLSHPDRRGPLEPNW